MYINSGMNTVEELLQESLVKMDEANVLVNKALEELNKEPVVPEVPDNSRWSIALDELEYTKTSGAWGRYNGGRDASRTEVMWNIPRLTSQYKSNLKTVAEEVGIPFCVLLGISCRESNHGYSLDSNGTGDGGNGFGCLQVDKRYHDVQGRPDPYSMEHIRQAAGILMDYLGQVENNHPTWADKYILKGGIVAYNSGVSNVQTINGMDVGTTGNDYGADTAARAQIYREEGVN